MIEANGVTGEVVVRASTSGDTFDVTTLVKQSILDEYPKCVILTKEESNGTNILVCYSDKPLYLDEEETTVRRISGTLGVVESYLRTSDEELLVQGTKTLYEVFPAVLYTKKYDINKDGVLDKADSDAIYDHFMGSATITDAETLENADINKDGVIDTTDAVLLQNIIESGEGSGFAIAWSNYTLDVLYKIFKGTLTNIADSIRAKTGKTDKVPPENMPEEIESISGSAEPTLQNKTFTENGTYSADAGFDALGEVVVNVQPKLQEKTATRNGDITPDSGFDGLSKVTVDYEPVLEDRIFDKNGIYYANTSEVDGIYKVIVDVEPRLAEIHIDKNGTYEAGLDPVGYSKIIVDVPSGGGGNFLDGEEMTF